MKRVGIIYDTSQPGLGGHGTHLAFRGLPGVETVALADSNVENIEARLKETGAKRHYADYHVMLEREKPDIVVLGSRLPGDHFAQIEAAAKLGIHILCEKPMSADLDEADRIVHLAEKYHIRIAVAHLARYAPVFLTMKRMIESGAIGRPLTFYGRGKEDERGGGEDMIVLGTHILDLGCFLFGRPDSVFAEVTAGGVRQRNRLDLQQVTVSWHSIISRTMSGEFSKAGGACSGIRCGWESLSREPKGCSVSAMTMNANSA